MSYNYRAQKAALTRALKTGDPSKVERATLKAIREWGSAWPDDWSRWERALRDVGSTLDMEALWRNAERYAHS